MKRIAFAVLLTQAALFGQYQYYYSDTFSTIDQTKWFKYGPMISSAQGLLLDSQGYWTEGALISLVASGSQNYEVKTTISLSAARIIHYLRATNYPYGPNAATYTVELVSSGGGVCNFNVYRFVSQTYTLLGSGAGPCSNGSTMRSVVSSPPGVNAQILVYFDNTLSASITAP